MQKRAVKKSVIYKWLLSYIFILLLPLIVFIASMMRFLSAYENEITQSNALVLEQTRLKMDHVLNEANSFVAEVSIDPIVRKLLAIYNKDEASPYDLYQATDIIKRLLLTKGTDFDSLIYFPRLDTVFSNSTYNSAENYYDIYLTRSGLTKNTWMDVIEQKYSLPHFFPLEYEHQNGIIDKKIAMIKPVMIEKHHGMYANIVIFFDGNQLFQFENDSFSRMNFAIIDSEDKLLYQTSNPEFGDGILDYSMLDPELDGINMELADEKVIVSHIKSEAVDWKYLIITKEKSYMEQLSSIRNSMYFSVALCCIVGIFMIFYLLKQNYTPLNTIIKRIEEVTFSSSKNTVNEYQYITQTINQLQWEKKSINDLMKQQKNTLRAQIVQNMIENRNDINEMELETLKRYGITFQSDLFLVLVFLIFEGDGPFPNDNESLDEKEKNKMICLIFQNITEELLREKGMRCYFFHIGKLIGFIINPKEMERDIIFNDINEKLEQIKESINQYFLIRFSPGCSDIHQSWENIPNAYSQALEVIEYKNMLDLKNIHFYHEIVKIPKEENFHYPDDMENHIVNNLKIGNEKKVCNAIQDIIHMNLENRATPDTMRYLMVNIAGTIIKVVNQLEKKVQCRIPQLSFQTLLQENNVSVMMDEVKKGVHSICETVLEKKGENKRLQGAVLYEEILEFVKKNYADKALNVGMIAEKLGVHVVYLSRTFMEYNGESLSGCIHKIRLKQAKKLIETGKTLEAISDKVGYGSLRTFMRVFKKYEGITPGQFKETVKNKMEREQKGKR